MDNFERALLIHYMNQSAAKVEELTAALAEAEQALQLACETLYDEGIWFTPGGEQVKNWQGWRTVFIERQKMTVIKSSD